MPAGDFDSFRVLCGRQGSRELTFYYVPEIGHYARMEAIGSDGKKTATRNLIAYEHGEIRVPRPAVVQRIAAVRSQQNQLSPPLNSN